MKLLMVALTKAYGFDSIKHIKPVADGCNLFYTFSSNSVLVTADHAKFHAS